MQGLALNHLRGRFMEQVPLADYNAWRVGGTADMLYIPADIEDTVHFLKQLPRDLPILWLGLGSNVLIRDGGLEGVVIVTQGALNEIVFQDNQCIRVEAGVSCAKAARFSARHGLQGLEFMAGIPGTVGGALAMNAGCYGGETWQRVISVETVNRNGQLQTRPATDYQINYRQVKGYPDEWFVAGHFQLALGEKTRALADIRVLLEKRNASQPTGLPNCGSVFRNPLGQHAAKLIEQSGLKGARMGGAIVSQKHANFIINEGNATATDIEALIEQVKEVVLQKHAVQLVPEVCIIGRTTSR